MLVFKTRINFFLHRTFTLGTGSPLRDGVSPFVLLAFTALLGSSSLVSATAIVLFLARRLREKARRKMKEEERMVRLWEFIFEEKY